jgi:hypothetical protein
MKRMVLFGAGTYEQPTLKLPQRRERTECYYLRKADLCENILNKKDLYSINEQKSNTKTK